MQDSIWIFLHQDNSTRKSNGKYVSDIKIAYTDEGKARWQALSPEDRQMWIDKAEKSLRATSYENGMINPKYGFEIGWLNTITVGDWWDRYQLPKEYFQLRDWLIEDAQRDTNLEMKVELQAGETINHKKRNKES